MITCKNIVWFGILAVLISVSHFVFSGDAATISATGKEKFRLSIEEKIVESAVVGVIASLIVFLLCYIIRYLVKKGVGK